jgi:hypothetical protein
MTELAHDLKRNEVLCFNDGVLTVKMTGHFKGWGQLAFHERQFIDADGYQVVEIPPSELLALRDFLNRVVPH